MRRIIFFLILSFLFLGAACETKKVCFSKYCFLVELAKTDEERASGLMFRNYLAPKSGMLFIFPKEGLYSFWMKNTRIPLDIIWLDNNKQIVFINKNTKPCEDSNCPAVEPEIKASYVLEINAGICDEIGLKIGDRLNF